LTEIHTNIVDVYVIRPAKAGYEALCLKRASGTRCAGTWETVHGHILDGETPADAGLRELREETGLKPARFYNVSRVESFYLHRQDAIVLIPVFCAIVAPHSSVTTSDEHDDSLWLAPDEAARKFAWPREAHALADVMALFGRGNAGGLEDVLRVS
jgi:8-oxo-dGTP pyrophosphatase MutT (NUDIX family)